MSAVVAANRAGSLRVRVEHTGALLGVHIDRDELRYGGTSLAAAILELYRRAHRDAIERRRSELLDDGMAADTLDRVHPPADTIRPPASSPQSWMHEL